MTIGELLRTARKKSNYTLDDVARRVILSKTYLSKIENNVLKPGELTCRQLADLYRINPRECMRLAGHVPHELRVWLVAAPENLDAAFALMENHEL